MICFPNAKINIGLNVISKREDGYHNLETVMYPVNIKDALEVVEAAEMKFESTGILIPGNFEDNLCLKAYNLLRKDFDLPNIHIHLHKNIPIGAGLGGGSSDAAFFVKLINDKFKLNLSIQNIQGYCKLLGSDCAFFVENKPVFAYNKGELFEPINLDLSSYHLAILMPNAYVSTQQAYNGVYVGKPVVSLKSLLNLPIEQWGCKVKNDFEKHILRLYPSIRLAKEYLQEAGSIFTLMSGSGAAVYGIFKDKPNLSGYEKTFKVFNDI